MLRAVEELAEDRQIVGLAPSTSAVHVLAGEADIPARTLQGFLIRYRDVGDGITSSEKTEEARRILGGTVLILDDASMVAKQRSSLMGRHVREVNFGSVLSLPRPSSIQRFQQRQPAPLERAERRNYHGKFVLIFIADWRHRIMVHPLSLRSLGGRARDLAAIVPPYRGPPGWEG